MASKQLNAQHPLAEVFGYKFDNFSKGAIHSRDNKLCPYNNIVEKCTKDKVERPLGVCSLIHKDAPTIICPVRFREDWIVCEDASQFFFLGDVDWTPLKEVRLKDKNGKAAGNIDLVVVHHDKKGKIIDFGAIEIQAVYISGNVRNPFEKYISNPAKNFKMDWRAEKNYPNPDYLSSSRKRLVPQLSFKGQILNAWNKKQVVVVDSPFFNSMPELEVTSKANSDLCWLVYKMDDSIPGRGYRIQLDKTVYTGFEETMKKIGSPEVGEVTDFIESLEEKLAATLYDLRNNYGVSSMSELLRKKKEATSNGATPLIENPEL